MDGQQANQWQAQNRALHGALFSASPFRQESGGQPLVYGYVRSSRRWPDYPAACRRALERYCTREHLHLCAVFTDMGMADNAVIRPGLAALDDVLRLPDSFAAVVVSTGHLSSDRTVAEVLVRRIRGTGARLLCVRQPHGCNVPQWWQ
jgi:hypothetical protein